MLVILAAVFAVLGARARDLVRRKTAQGACTAARGGSCCCSGHISDILRRQYFLRKYIRVHRAKFAELQYSSRQSNKMTCLGAVFVL